MTRARQQGRGIGTGSRSARAYAALKELVLQGTLAPGDRMNVRVLAERLDLSATPVKAALAALARDGFVTAERNRGFFVTVLRDQDVRELFELREALEPYAARLAAGRGVEPAQLDELRRLTAAQREAAAVEDLPRYNDLNLRFHEALWGLADNGRLDRLMADVVGQMSLVTTFTSRAPGRLERAIDEHGAIVDLCESRDPAGLAGLVARHVRDSYAAYRQMTDLDTWGPPRPSTTRENNGND